MTARPFAGCFFNYTSNVDAHAYDHWGAHEVRECHGNVELMQCAARCSFSCLWRAPGAGACWRVNTQTMLATPGLAEQEQPLSQKVVQDRTNSQEEPCERRAAVGATTGTARTHALRELLAAAPSLAACDAARFPADEFPRCTACGASARPAVCMFNDGAWVEYKPAAHRYDEWAESVSELAAERRATTAAPEAISATAMDSVPSGKAVAKESASPDKPAAKARPQQQPLRVVVLEIGAGLRVTTVRREAENMACEWGKHGAQVTLVRVNPDFPVADDPAEMALHGVAYVPLVSGALSALRLMDEAVRAHDDGSGE